MLSPDDFTRIMQALRRHFHVLEHAEIAIELDPRKVDAGRVAAYAGSGVNRVSLGVQDFDNKVMDAVNRHQPFELSANAVHLLRQAGIDNINCDLIYGLPYQSVTGMGETVTRLLTLTPNRVSLFGYAQCHG